MNETPEMSWTCPNCQARNLTMIAAGIEAGKIVDVRCQSCETEHEASVFFPLTQAGQFMTVGVVWI